MWVSHGADDICCSDRRLLPAKIIFMIRFKMEPRCLQKPIKDQLSSFTSGKDEPAGNEENFLSESENWKKPCAFNSGELNPPCCLSTVLSISLALQFLQFHHASQMWAYTADCYRFYLREGCNERALSNFQCNRMETIPSHLFGGCCEWRSEIYGRAETEGSPRLLFHLWQ